MAVHPVPISKRTANVFNFQLVTNAEVEKAIKSIKRSKATGIDDLPPGLIKDAASVISVPLSHIINLSLETGNFPQQWKVAKLVLCSSQDRQQTLITIDQYPYFL